MSRRSKKYSQSLETLEEMIRISMQAGFERGYQEGYNEGRDSAAKEDQTRTPPTSMEPLHAAMSPEGDEERFV